jgi:hypothetical protein
MPGAAGQRVQGVDLRERPRRRGAELLGVASIERSPSIIGVIVGSTW